ncbi:translation initiation factor IF-2-like [Phodopus roborovskii]|uniref:translation initiation factor IF-2-like n=1 Tax=Phodopus roborovskii TaxID=109678 RepID=UPI0021E48207|nr:translation initiation factor IF-2-like [Phodopus roborovskii]
MAAGPGVGESTGIRTGRGGPGSAAPRRPSQPSLRGPQRGPSHPETRGQVHVSLPPPPGCGGGGWTGVGRAPARPPRSGAPAAASGSQDARRARPAGLRADPDPRRPVLRGILALMGAGRRQGRDPGPPPPPGPRGDPREPRARRGADLEADLLEGRARGRARCSRAARGRPGARSSPPPRHAPAAASPALPDVSRSSRAADRPPPPAPPARAPPAARPRPGSGRPPPPQGGRQLPHVTREQLRPESPGLTRGVGAGEPPARAAPRGPYRESASQEPDLRVPGSLTGTRRRPGLPGSGTRSRRGRPRRTKGPPRAAQRRR